MVMMGGHATDDEVLSFYRLSFQVDGDEVVVGRPAGDNFGVFPADGAALLRHLQRGASLREAARWYEEEFAEAVDMTAFVTHLDELGLLRQADDPPDPDGSQPRWQGVARFVFSRPAALLCACVVALAIAGCFRHPNLVPARHDVFFSRSLLIVELTVLVGQVPLTLVHELAHLLAGRRLGVASRIRMGHRLTVVVFETVLDGLVLVPRRRRYLPLAAGVLADVVMMGVLVDAAWLLRDLGPRASLPMSICLALAFTTLPRILWQLFFFLRTDGYYLLATALRCDDLDAAGRDVVRQWWCRHAGGIARLVTPRAARSAMLPPDRSPRDRQAGRVFAPFLVAGYAVFLATFVVVVLPLAWHFGDRIVEGFSRGGVWRWDAAGVLVLNLGEPVAARLLAWRERRHAARCNLQPQPVTTPTA